MPARRQVHPALLPGSSLDVEERGRWITVGGRRWRATDPSIPPVLRTELVSELMAARRAVAVAKRSGTAVRAEDLRAIRRRVHAAKLALGERGALWWNDQSDEELRPRVEAVIEVLTHHRAPDGSICPSDAARVVGREAWRDVMDLVREVALDMADRGVLDVTQSGQVVCGRDVAGPIRLRQRSVKSDQPSGEAEQP